MERALDIELLTNALGDHRRLPSPANLQELLADAEIGLFIGRANLEPRLLDAAWYLQSVATAREDLRLFDIERQRQAHQVSAHIFDVALQGDGLTKVQTLQYTFAAQVAYLGGELTPNAAALARRLSIAAEPEPSDSPGVTGSLSIAAEREPLNDPGIASLQAGILLLALDRPALYPLLRTRIDQLSAVAIEAGDLGDSQYASADGVIRGIYELLTFLTYGKTLALARASRHLMRAIETRGAPSDVESRWVAAHLLRIRDDLESNSVWSVLPPNLSSVARALTLGDPPVLQLWPPQLSLLGAGRPSEPSPLDPSARRIVLSFPTSAGKSLLAQVFVTAHVVDGNGDVCIVAPTHSLCREISASLRRRLRTLGSELYTEPPLGLGGAKPAGARAVVMTPEKLAARLRSDPAGLLNDFGMFVIDEAHLVADPDRGWRLEETLSLLHHLTEATHHRILMLSAALGNQAHVVAWLDPGDGFLARQEDWRGPRRLSVIFTTRPQRESGSLEPAIGNRLARRVAPLAGEVYLRTGVSGRFVRGEFSDPVGTLVERRRRDGRWVRDQSRSTNHSAQLVPLITHIRTTGSVLVIQPTKSAAQRLAEELAATLREDPANFALTDLVRARLGHDHPLARVVSRGVAFHHSALPVDIQSELEDAVRRGQITCLVATTTLTEGVNLPFKSVIVAQRGYRDTEGFVEVIDDARLLNAVGRAGRSGRETEGWLILAEQRRFTSSMFQPLDQTAADLDMLSTMASEAALQQLATIEENTREGVDALFTTIGREADGFVSSVWFIAQALSELGDAPTEASVLQAIRATLAWQQLNDTGRARLLVVASRAFRAYSQQPVEERRRWARSGLSLSSSASLEAVASQVVGILTEDIARSEPAEAVAAILGDGRLASILDLSENRRRGFKERRNAPRGELLTVDIMALLIAWVSGTDLQELADKHLAAVAREDYRYEQLAEFIASVFEHYLPWILGTVITWVNEALESRAASFRIPENLAAAVHYGVATGDALSLMLGGVRSRRLANRVAQGRAAAGSEVVATPLRDWLASQDISAWRGSFDASPTEIADLLTFARDPSVELVNRVLEGEEYTLPYVARLPILFESDATIGREPDQRDPAPFGISVGSEIVGTISPEHHDDVELLTGIGIPLDARVRPATPTPVLVLRLAPDAEV